MLKSTKEWDIRVTDEIVAKVFSKDVLPWYRPDHKGRAWYRCNAASAKVLADLICEAYGASRIARVEQFKGKACYGWYNSRNETIGIRPASHIKTVIHEVYHHLDYSTGLYDSDDRRGGSTSLAWRFAELYWEALRDVRKKD